MTEPSKTTSRTPAWRPLIAGAAIGAPAQILFYIGLFGSTWRLMAAAGAYVGIALLLAGYWSVGRGVGSAEWWARRTATRRFGR